VGDNDGPDATTGARDADRASEPGTDDPASKGGDEGFDLKGIVRQLTAPMIESLDSRLRDQIEAHVDELLDKKLDAALTARFATVDRAIADLSRSIEALDRRFGAHDEDDDAG